MKIIMSGLLLLLLVACSRPIPPQIREALDREFSTRAMDSGWRFVKITHGFGGKELVADILVSAPLAGTEPAQHESLRLKVCPDAGKVDLWKKLQGYKLAIVAYTENRKFTVLVDCENPLEPVVRP